MTPDKRSILLGRLTAASSALLGTTAALAIATALTSPASGIPTHA